MKKLVLIEYYNFEINYRTYFIILLIFWIRKISAEIIVL